MTEIRHFPPAGQSLTAGGHTTIGGTCKCGPTFTSITKRNGVGRFGKHQGYRVIRVEWHHNFIPVEEPQKPQESTPGMFLFADDRAYAAREDVALSKLKALTDAMPSTHKLSA